MYLLSSQRSNSRKEKKGEINKKNIMHNYTEENKQGQKNLIIFTSFITNEIWWYCKRSGGSGWRS